MSLYDELITDNHNLRCKIEELKEEVEKQKKKYDCFEIRFNNVMRANNELIEIIRPLAGEEVDVVGVFECKVCGAFTEDEREFNIEKVIHSNDCKVAYHLHLKTLYDFVLDKGLGNV